MSSLIELGIPPDDALRIHEHCMQRAQGSGRREVGQQSLANRPFRSRSPCFVRGRPWSRVRPYEGEHGGVSQSGVSSVRPQEVE